MTDHPCPFDAGTLLALGAIAETRSAAAIAGDGSASPAPAKPLPPNHPAEEEST